MSLSDLHFPHFLDPIPSAKVSPCVLSFLFFVIFLCLWCLVVVGRYGGRTVRVAVVVPPVIPAMVIPASLSPLPVLPSGCGVGLFGVSCLTWCVRARVALF